MRPYELWGPIERGCGPAALRSLGSVLTPRLPAVFNTQRIAGTADDLVAYSRQVANSTTADQNNRELLQIVAFPGNIHGHFFAIGEAHTRNLSQRRVRLFRGHGPYLQANSLLLRAAIQDRRLGKLAFLLSIMADQLIDRGHFSGR